MLTEFIGLSNVLYEVIDTAMDTIVFSDFADRFGMIAVEHKEYALAQDDSCRITAIVAATRVVTDVNVRAKASRYVGEGECVTGQKLLFIPVDFFESTDCMTFSLRGSLGFEAFSIARDLENPRTHAFDEGAQDLAGKGGIFLPFGSAAAFHDHHPAPPYSRLYQAVLTAFRSR